MRTSVNPLLTQLRGVFKWTNEKGLSLKIYTTEIKVEEFYCGEQVRALQPIRVCSA